MSYKKIINKWKDNIPVNVQKEMVFIVLDGFFENVSPPQRGSHYKIYDSRFEKYIKMFPGTIDFSYDGRFTIPVKKGKWIKKIWVKRILRVIDLINSIDQGD